MSVIARFDGDNRFLSNFYPANSQVILFGDRMNFLTAEHAFQAGKASCIQDGKEARQYAFSLAKSSDTKFAKLQGAKARIDVKQWDSIKDDVMRQVVFSKFLLNSDLCARLLSTGTQMLVEGNDWNDTYWGRCEGKGLNRLGAILMEVRGYWWYAGKTNIHSDPQTAANVLMGW